MKNMKNKKWLVRVCAMLVLVVTVVLLAAPALADHDTSEGKTYKVITRNGLTLNLRNGPAKTYRRCAKIPNHAKITLYEILDGGKWAEVEYKGNIGYVMTQFIKPVAA